MRLKLIDLFCKAGGASMGYYRAGFDVIGVDIEPQPNYPFPFYQGDAIDVMLNLLEGYPFKASDGNWYYLEDFSALAGSPPCQNFSPMRRGLWQDRQHPDLIAPTRAVFRATQKPYVIENVQNARKSLVDPIILCGSMFGLQTSDGNQLRRHRCFETSFPLTAPKCQHNSQQVVGVYGHSGGKSKRDGLKFFGTEDWKVVMGIDWMTGTELAQAIPPMYTEYIGKQLLKHLA